MIRLKSDVLLVCESQPQLGGCITGLWLDGVPVLQSTRGPLALGLHTLQPGETLTAEMSIAVERVQ